MKYRGRDEDVLSSVISFFKLSDVRPQLLLSDMKDSKVYPQKGEITADKVFNMVAKFLSGELVGGKIIS